MSKRTSLYPYARTAFFIVAGLMNTVFIKPEDVGNWQNYVGYLLLVLAVIDIVILLIKPKKKTNEKKMV